nr:hypothetical protein [Tanacetum cinerariifolium]
NHHSTDSTATTSNDLITNEVIKRKAAMAVEGI